jgi:hypothetical protein
MGQAFKKNQIIENKVGSGKFRAIVVDEELAVFAPVTKKKDGGWRTRFGDMFVLSNDEATVDKSCYPVIDELKI